MILVFVKYPEPGHVKTRLALCIGADAAAELYRAFILDILSTLKIAGFPFRICFCPEDKRALLLDWLGKEHHYMPQRGQSLGERMKNGFVDAFADGNERVIIIGSDSPDLPPSILREAFDGLSIHDVVIGPSRDGGYYLIGFKKNTFLPSIFDNIPWSTPSVFSATMAVLRNSALDVYMLPEWNDIDTVDDIKQLVLRSSEGPFARSKTMELLTRIIS
ncbi:MAG: TIGR04282 family arsenosugar biosynthesis glycosyltransferase [Pseudomonadota bacterium]